MKNKLLSTLEDIDGFKLDYLINLVEDNKVELPVWGKKDYARIMKEAVDTKDSEKAMIVKDFILFYRSTLHREFRYSRQTVAYRVLNSISSALDQLEVNQITSCAASIRLALESISSFEKSVNRVIKPELIRLEKKKKKNSANQEKINELDKLFGIVQTEINQTTSKMQINWSQYLKGEGLHEYKQEEGYANLAITRGNFLENIKKMSTSIAPHNSSDWGLVYKLLNDLCHPSIGTRLTMNSESAELSRHGGLDTRIIDLSFDNNDVLLPLVVRVKEDLRMYCSDLINIAYELDKLYEQIESDIMVVCQDFVRTQFKIDKKYYKEHILNNFNVYEECICMSGCKLKFCCGDMSNL